MIAHAKPGKFRLRKSEPATSGSVSRKPKAKAAAKVTAGPKSKAKTKLQSKATAKPKAKSKPGSKVAADKAARRRLLAERREKLFSTSIDYIPCRDFLKADAERLASTPPDAARVPLERTGAPPAGDGVISPYIARLYDTRLLAKEEEQYYFRRMNWLKFRAATARGKLDRRRATLRQMEKVESLLAEAENVKQIIITANLRLVVSIAKKFVDPCNAFEDLVSEGNMALMRSVEKFNFALGNRFSTYATYAIQRHFYRLSQKSRQRRNRFVSDDSALQAVVASTPDHDHCSTSQVEELRQTFAGFLSELEPREQQIVVARFGFDGRPPRTFRELGSSMGVCKERIRQIQGRAMEKLRLLANEAKLEQTVGDWL